jgi:hypothetical protein
MIGILYVIATVLFAVAGFKGGIHSDNNDLLYFGLAFFSAAHIVEPYFPVRSTR